MCAAALRLRSRRSLRSHTRAEGREQRVKPPRFLNIDHIQPHIHTVHTSGGRVRVVCSLLCRCMHDARAREFSRVAYVTS